MATKKNGSTSSSQFEAAKRVLDALRGARKDIAGYRVPRTGEEMQKLTLRAGVSDAFLERVAVGVDGHPN